MPKSSYDPEEDIKRIVEGFSDRNIRAKIAAGRDRAWADLNRTQAELDTLYDLSLLRGESDTTAVVSPATLEALRPLTEWTGEPLRLPNGNYRIPVDKETLDRIGRLRMPGESDNDVLRRVMGIGRENPGRQFATLFEAFRASMFDPGRMKPYYPLDMLDKATRLVFDRLCRELIPEMHKAHRVVLEADFTTLAATMLTLSPRHILAALATARMPYENLWIEWDETARQRVLYPGSEIGALPRAGMLIRPHAASSRDNAPTYTATIVGWTRPGGAAIPTSVGLAFCLTTPLAGDARRALQQFGDLFPDDLLSLMATSAVGPVFEGDTSPAKLELERHALCVPIHPLGLLQGAAINRMRENGEAEAIDRQMEWLRKSTVNVGGLFCWVVAVLALLAHLPDRDVVRRQIKVKGGYAKSRIVPGYRYEIVTLRRPIEARRAFATIQHEVEHRGPRAEHPVVGAWHHRRKGGDPNCPHIWVRRLDEEGNPIGKDQQYCSDCGRLRWWVKGHRRGDARYGVIRKGYDVVAAPPPG